MSEPNGAIAVFATVASANRALESLQASGFDMKGVSVFGPGRTNEVLAPELQHDFWSAWGSVVGAAEGGAAISVPVLASVVGLGPFAPIFAAIAVSATTLGSLTTALVGHGVHEAHALRYEEALRAGKTVIVAHTDDLGRLETARTRLSSASPEHVDVHGLR